MKKWNNPQIEELEIKETAKKPDFENGHDNSGKDRSNKGNKGNEFTPGDDVFVDSLS